MTIEDPTVKPVDPTITGATPQPADVRPGYRRVVVAAHHFDVPIEPDGIIDRVWSGIGSKPADMENLACELYAAVAALAFDQVARDAAAQSVANGEPGADDDDSPLDPASFDSAARSAAYLGAIADLRSAARHMQRVRLALAPYVTAEKLRRGY